MSTVHYENRIVAFIDILGFKSLIEETQQASCTQNKVTNIKEAFDLISVDTSTLKFMQTISGF